MWSLFFRKNAKTKKCVSTAQACADCMWAHPMERPGRPQNQRKDMTYFRTYFFNQKMQEYEKKGSQKGPKRVSICPGWRPWGRLGRPLMPQSVFEHKKYAQSAPKMTSRVQKWRQNAKKVTPKVAKCTLTGLDQSFYFGLVISDSSALERLAWMGAGRRKEQKQNTPPTHIYNSKFTRISNTGWFVGSSPAPHRKFHPDDKELSETRFWLHGHCKYIGIKLEIEYRWSGWDTQNQEKPKLIILPRIFVQILGCSALETVAWMVSRETGD